MFQCFFRFVPYLQRRFSCFFSEVSFFSFISCWFHSSEMVFSIYNRNNERHYNSKHIKNYKNVCFLVCSSTAHFSNVVLFQNGGAVLMITDTSGVLVGAMYVCLWMKVAVSCILVSFFVWLDECKNPAIFSLNDYAERHVFHLHVVCCQMTVVFNLDFLFIPLNAVLSVHVPFYSESADL